MRGLILEPNRPRKVLGDILAISIDSDNCADDLRAELPVIERFRIAISGTHERFNRPYCVVARIDRRVGGQNCGNTVSHCSESTMIGAVLQ